MKLVLNVREGGSLCGLEDCRDGHLEDDGAPHLSWNDDGSNRNRYTGNGAVASLFQSCRSSHGQASVAHRWASYFTEDQILSIHSSQRTREKRQLFTSGWNLVDLRVPVPLWVADAQEYLSDLRFEALGQTEEQQALAMQRYLSGSFSSCVGLVEYFSFWRPVLRIAHEERLHRLSIEAEAMRGVHLEMAAVWFRKHMDLLRRNSKLVSITEREHVGRRAIVEVDELMRDYHAIYNNLSLDSIQQRSLIATRERSAWKAIVDNALDRAQAHRVLLPTADFAEPLKDFSPEITSYTSHLSAPPVAVTASSATFAPPLDSATIDDLFHLADVLGVGEAKLSNVAAALRVRGFVFELSAMAHCFHHVTRGGSLGRECTRSDLAMTMNRKQFGEMMTALFAYGQRATEGSHIFPAQSHGYGQQAGTDRGAIGNSTSEFSSGGWALLQAKVHERGGPQGDYPSHWTQTAQLEFSLPPSSRDTPVSRWSEFPSTPPSMLTEAQFQRAHAMFSRVAGANSSARIGVEELCFVESCIRGEIDQGKIQQLIAEYGDGSGGVDFAGFLKIYALMITK
jgi:hypothetical protein